MFSENLKYLRNKFNMDQQELADKLGRKSTSTISEWEKGKYTPKAGTLSDIAHIFNVKIDDLMSDNLQDNMINNINKADNDINLIYNQLNNKRQECVYNFAKAQLEDQKGQSDNVFEMHRSFHEIKLAGIVSAGTGEFQIDDAANETVPYYGTIPAHDYALRVNGDSMSPMLENHQIIFVRKSNGAELHTGQIIVAMLNGDSYVKKIDLNNHCVKLVSLNPKYKPIRVTPTDKFMVQGVVLL